MGRMEQIVAQGEGVKDRSCSVTKHQIQNADRPMELQCSYLHVAGGCAPTTDTLNLVAAGVATDARAFIPS